MGVAGIGERFSPGVLENLGELAFALEIAVGRVGGQDAVENAEVIGDGLGPPVRRGGGEDQFLSMVPLLFQQ